MIVSFYSYKGGVGRTQLCANIAAYLCYKKGKRVLLWDWDFEAPGLHYFFGKENKDINTNGTLELLEEYIRLMRSKSGIKEENLKFPTKENIIELAKLETIDDDSSEPVIACIDLLPAGNLASNFNARINDFNWFEFYELLDGINYMEILKKKLEDLSYDYIFIDSRTGISDYSGICNIQLPDVNVFLMAANNQNFNGCSRIAEQIINSDYVKKGYRKPILMPILSRLDRSHPKFDEWIRDFVDRFSILMPNLDEDLEEDFHEEVFADVYLQETFLEYVQSFSAGENILFSVDKQKVSRVSFEQKYINIAEFIQKLKNYGKIQIDELIDKDTWIDYAETAVKSKNNRKAAIAYQHADKNDKANELGGTSKSWFTTGNESFLKGDKDKAIEYYQKAVEIKPDYHAAINNMGLAYEYKGNLNKAIECYQKVLQFRPDDHEAYYNMGITYGTLGDKDKAIECYEKAIEIKPDYHEAFNNMGLSFSEKGSEENALECYNKAIKIKPDKALTYYNMGITYFNVGNKNKAIECYKNAIEIKADYHEAVFNMGSVYSNIGNNDKSIECFERVIELNPDYLYEAFNNMGLAYYNNGEEDKAIKSYQKAIELKPDYHLALYNLGLTYSNNGNTDKAIECYQKIIEIKPDYYKALNNLGLAYFNKNNTSKALECYQKAIETNPKKRETYVNMGIVYDKIGDTAKAIECYQKVIEIEPDNNRGYMSLGFIYLTLGDLELSEKNLKKSIELGSMDYGNMNLGHVYFAKKKNDKAFEFYLLGFNNFTIKSKFFEGYDDDYKYLEQYDIKKEEYNKMRDKLQKEANKLTNSATSY